MRKRAEGLAHSKCSRIISESKLNEHTHVMERAHWTEWVFMPSVASFSPCNLGEYWTPSCLGEFGYMSKCHKQDDLQPEMYWKTEIGVPARSGPGESPSLACRRPCAHMAFPGCLCTKRTQTLWCLFGWRPQPHQTRTLPWWPSYSRRPHL